MNHHQSINCKASVCCRPTILLIKICRSAAGVSCEKLEEKYDAMQLKRRVKHTKDNVPDMPS